LKDGKKEGKQKKDIVGIRWWLLGGKRGKKKRPRKDPEGLFGKNRVRGITTRAGLAAGALKKIRENH